MLKINKNIEPAFLLKFKRKNIPKTWYDYNNGTIKSELKEYILENEQSKYCLYCEKSIYNINEGHIEHIKPRDLFPKLFQKYNNLIVSCNEKNSCGSAKQNKYSEEFINPVIENPKDFLTYNLASGEIIPTYKDVGDIRNKRASYTIELLNLNNYVLKDARKNLIQILEVYRANEEITAYLQYFLDDGYNFPSLIRFYMEG
ncbi:retron system putative HNH endonuclease [Clostridium sp.]|uniref:retron system putative HNH endonuclease n=1 Tax=Clostridium sp. TaxID=1506 RepID=UPI001A57FC6C|nr:retron system putative HNH endonuclease [Clostridium sp.]MBK5242549.1 TIGR02646 family protein [Clostridium sp.]